MFVWAITIHLESPVNRVSTKLPVSTGQICLDEPFDILQYGCDFKGCVVSHTRTRMGRINRVRALNIEAIIMYNSSQGIAIFLNRTRWDTIKFLPYKELFYVIRRLPRTANHLTQFHLFLHPFSKPLSPRDCIQRRIVFHRALRTRRIIFKMAHETLGELRQDMLFNWVVYKKFLQCPHFRR